MRIGVDVGGTNTDAALLKGDQVIASVKSPTTGDVASGVIQSVRMLLEAQNVAADAIEVVMIGTTQFTNAFVERRALDKVAVIRMCLPAGQSLRPLADWPEELLDAIGRNTYLVPGGLEFDGQEISPIDEPGLRAIAAELKDKGISSAAISSIFSPIDGRMERKAGQILMAEMPDLTLSSANELGRVGLIERENAAAMNASLASLSRKVVRSFVDALENLAIGAPLFISQNDGTLMSAQAVERYPVLTFASGPTNSMRGAAYLSGLSDCLVLDIGGTTTDVGVLVNGFPRESSVAVDIGSVRTNFRMPDILAIGLGGGSVVEASANQVTVGPKSVGYLLPEKAMVFGGQTVTATDIAVAAGYADVGDRDRVRGLDKGFVEQAVQVIHQMAETAIERMKTSRDDTDAVLVGGGAILINRPLRGVRNLITPERSGEANAIGAAIAQIGGEVDSVRQYEDGGREAALNAARNEACEKAIMAGADASSVKVVDIEEVPLSYAPRGAVRVRVKAIGDLVA